MKLIRRNQLFLIFILLFCLKGFSQSINIDSCLTILKKSKNDTNKVILLDRLAWEISYNDLKNALRYSKQSMGLAEKLKFESFFSKIYYTQGSIYDDMAEFPTALNLFLTGLTYAKKNEQILMVANINNSLGNLYYKRGNIKKAQTYYFASLKIFENKIKPNICYVVYNNLSLIYQFRKQLDSAKYYINLCFNYNTSNKNTLRIIENYISLSEIYLEEKNPDLTLEYAKKAVELAEKENNNYTLTYAYIQLGYAYNLNKFASNAIIAFNNAKKCNEKTGDISAIESITKGLSEIYENINDYKDGLKYFKEYKMYADSNANKESAQLVKIAEAKFENEKNQKQIELLGEKQKLNEIENHQKKIYLYIACFGIFILITGLLYLYRNIRLKQKVNLKLEAYNNEVNWQKELLEAKNKEITDSINYAKRIQQSILTNDAYFKKHTTDYFILFKPKDIVSGNFYWALNHEGKFILMTADCTGHGVPGAMMSMMGINFLSEIVSEKKITSPANILNQLRKDIIKTLNQEGSLIETKDGLDCSLCSFDFIKMTLTYTNANNKFYIIRNNQLITSETNKMPIGAGHNSEVLFKEWQINLEKNDIIITLTDGFADQFGGPKGKKYKYNQLEKLLLASAHLPLSEIRNNLNHSFKNWKNNLEQVDDICLIGIKI